VYIYENIGLSVHKFTFHIRCDMSISLKNKTTQGKIKSDPDFEK